jgi:hypothetical protein
MEEIERQASRRFTTAERAGRREIHYRLAPNSRRCQPVSELPPSSFAANVGPTGCASNKIGDRLERSDLKSPGLIF